MSEMAMLPNGYHPGNRCSCRECLERYPSMPSGSAETKAGHTPGPWKADKYGIRDVGGYIVALHWPHRYEGQDARFQKETSEREGDARLIAAALCMADLLTDLLEDLDKQADVNHNGDGPNWAMSRAQEVREVLRKAGRVVK